MRGRDRVRGLERKLPPRPPRVLKFYRELSRAEREQVIADNLVDGQPPIIIEKIYV